MHEKHGTGIKWVRIIEMLQRAHYDENCQFFTMPYRMSEDFVWMDHVVRVQVTFDWRNASDLSAARLLPAPEDYAREADYRAISEWLASIQRGFTEDPPSRCFYARMKHPETGELMQFRILPMEDDDHLPHRGLIIVRERE